MEIVFQVIYELNRMNAIKELLKKQGYSDKGISFYVNKESFGEMKDPSINYSYTGPCGDTIEIFIKIQDHKIIDAKFLTIGCIGAFIAGSALTSLIKGKLLEEAEMIDENQIKEYIGRIPPEKYDCICLARRTLNKAIKKYKCTILKDEI